MLREDALASGRYKRVPDRWQTEFGRWLADYSVPRLVAALAKDPDLRVTPGAVYLWLKGTAPRPARAVAMVELSRGQLTLEAIYRHCREVRSPANPTARVDPRHGGRALP